MGGASGLFEPREVGRLRGSAIAGESALLLRMDPVQKLRRARSNHAGGGRDLVDGPPAVEAAVVAEEGGGHLDAPVAGDPVKVVFIALISSPDRPLEPEAGLDGAVGHQVISLSFEHFCHSRGKALYHDAPLEGDGRLNGYSGDLMRGAKKAFIIPKTVVTQSRG